MAELGIGTMRVVVRTDSSDKIGAGHVMRCLALGHALRDQGAEICFVCRELPGDIRSAIVSAGFLLESLQENSETTLVQKDDAACTASIIERVFGRADWVVVDHYDLDIEWEQQVRGRTSNLLVIDDLPNRKHDVDLLLDQSLRPPGASPYSDLVPQECRLLEGPHYALLRPEFALTRAKTSSRVGAVRNIVVSFGGTATAEITLRALRALHVISLEGAGVDVLAGFANDDAKIKNSCEDYGFRYHEGARVAELFSSADLAIGAAGGTTFERACLGVPSVAISLAANQEPGAFAFGSSGYCLYLGRAEEVSDSRLQCAIQTLLCNESLRRFFSARSMDLVDGKGAKRVAREMLPCPISLRLARESDGRNLYEWRNAKHVRMASFDRQEIPWEEHERWFRATVQSSAHALLIAECREEPIGVIRYDIDGDEAAVSLYVLEAKQGQGFGTAILRAGNAWMHSNRPGVHSIIAEIAEENTASCAAVVNAGYAASKRVYEFPLRDASQSEPRQ